MKLVATDDKSGAAKVTLDGDTGTISAGGAGSVGELTLINDAGQGDVWFVARKTLLPPAGGSPGPVTTGTVGPVGTIGQVPPSIPIRLPASIGVHGFVFARNDTGSDTFTADGTTGILTMRSNAGKDRIVLNAQQAHLSVGGQQADGAILVLDKTGAVRVTIDGSTGDIALANGDCAEFFDVADEAQATALPAGAVVVLDDDGKIRASNEAYDDRVAGVLSGAAGFKPGLLLDFQAGVSHRRPVALMGKVFCQTDAGHGPVRAGDLLTTSPTPGHAMRVADKSRALGAVLGKALSSLPEGRGLIPILVMLR
jgi:hypothetical protein